MTDNEGAQNDSRWMCDENSALLPNAPAMLRKPPWKVLIVDDDTDVHVGIRLAIQNIRYKDCELLLLFATSAQEGFERIAANPDVALILLDVIMETDNAGLNLVHRIRNDLDNQSVRIVLCTGHADQVPEQDVILNYDISDYKTKTELTAAKLFFTIIASLRAYETLQTLEQTNRRQAATLALLKDSEERYRVLFDNPLVPILLFSSEDGTIVDANLAAERFYGYCKQQFRHMHLFDIDPQPPEAILATLALGKHESQRCFRLTHRLASGELRLLEIRSGPIEIKGRKLRYSFLIDVTERQAAEMALASETARLHALLETASDGIHILDEEGNLVQFNHAFATMLGYESEEIATFNVQNWVFQKSKDQVLDTIRNLSDEPKMFESRHLRKDGIIIDVEINAKKIELNGKRYIYASSRDITDRKATEAQLRKLSLAVEQSPESIVITNLDAEIEYVNAAFTENSGYRRDEIIGQNPRILQSGKTPQEVYVSLWDTVPNGRSWKGEFHNRRKDGSEFVELAVISPLRQPDGTITHYVSVQEDISERKQYEAELKRAKEIAESANHAKSRFLATMSHEIRTPMNAILGMAQMLRMPDVGDAERKDYAETILASGDLLLNLLNDILDLSKVEAGQFELESFPLDPRQIIQGVQVLFAGAANNKRLKIESRWNGPSVQRYLGDPHRLRQMLANLVSNALKFTAQGQILIEASEVGRDGQDAILEFSVSDTGIGIPKEKQPLLFKAFSQTDSSTTRQYGGTGLGLSIVHRLALLMGGVAGVESEAGHGSRFWFRIRAGCVTAGTDNHEAAENSIAVVRSGGLGGRILVVEDNPTNRKIVKVMLKMSDLQCDFVEDGQQAVDAITGGLAPDLVLMDCQMPVMDGFEATQRIRHWEVRNDKPHVTIVALTAGAFEVDRKHCLDVGMDDFLVKPIAFEELMATLGRWLPDAKYPVVQTHPAEPSAQDRDSPVFSEKKLLFLLGGDREFARSIILSVQEGIPAYLDQLETAIATGNREEAARKAHTLKGLAAQIGGVRLSERFNEVHESIKRGTTDASVLADLRQEYSLLVDAWHRWL